MPLNLQFFAGEGDEEQRKNSTDKTIDDAAAAGRKGRHYETDDRTD